MQINMKIDGVTGAFDTDTGRLVCVQSAKYSKVELCFAESMNIPFAKIKLHDRDRYVDAQAVFDDAARLGQEIARRWNECPALEEENRRLTDVMVTGLTPDHVDGGMVLGLEGGMLQVMAECFAETFKGHGAENFLTMDFESRKTGDRYTVTMQKAGGDTPAAKNARLEARIKELEEALLPLANLDLRGGGFDSMPDSQTVYARDNTRITVGDVRRAARLREGPPETGADDDGFIEIPRFLRRGDD